MKVPVLLDLRVLAPAIEVAVLSTSGQCKVVVVNAQPRSQSLRGLVLV